MTEADQEWCAKPVIVPLPGPEGGIIYRAISQRALVSLQALRDIEEPDDNIVRRSLDMQKRTKLPYEDCLSFVVMAGPIEE